ncbi:MAG: flagellar export chaperone FliS [Steroidobacteraceae bacterium]
MSGYVRNSKLAAYQSVSVHGGVANSDPHGLVLMLMDAAVERMTTARGCMERGDIVRKAKLLHSCISLIAELRGCLDMARGGAIAQNLSDLYDYMMRQLLRANVDNNPAFISEVLSLLAEIRSAWVAIGPEVRQMARVVPPSA